MEGDEVAAGATIGRIHGPKGNAVEAQLHLEIIDGGLAIDPVPFLMAAASPELRDQWRPAAFKILRQLAPVLCKRIRNIDKMTGDLLSQKPETDTAEARQAMLDQLKGGA